MYDTFISVFKKTHTKELKVINMLYKNEFCDKNCLENCRDFLIVGIPRIFNILCTSQRKEILC